MYLIAVPSLSSNFFDSGLEHSQTEKVHVAILLLVVLLITFCKVEAVQRVVMRRMAFYGRVGFISACSE